MAKLAFNNKTNNIGNNMVSSISQNSAALLQKSADSLQINTQENKEKKALEKHIVSALELILDAAVSHHTNSHAGGAHGATGGGAAVGGGGK